MTRRPPVTAHRLTWPLVAGFFIGHLLSYMKDRTLPSLTAVGIDIAVLVVMWLLLRLMIRATFPRMDGPA